MGTDYRLSTSASASVWLTQRRRTRRALDESAYAIVNPERVDVGAVATGRGFPYNLTGTWAALPYASLEGEEIMARIGGSSVVRSGGEATEQRFKRDLAQPSYALIHFGTHAIVDEVEPARSALVLAEGGDDDGFLQAREIGDFDLEDRIVVLYACGSAAGDIRSGEGAMSLGRAFLAAGARAVVGNLWALRDDDAYFLSQHLYAALARGESIAAAARTARQAAVDSGRPPPSWAGLVVLGDGSAVPFPDGSPSAKRRRILLFVAALFALTAMVAGAWAIRKASSP